MLHPSSEPLLRPELVSVFCDALELRLQHQEGDDLTIVLKEEVKEGESTKATKIDLSSAVLVVPNDTVKSQTEPSSDQSEESEGGSDGQKQEQADTSLVTAEQKAESNEGKLDETERKQEESKRYIITIHPNVLNSSANFTLTAPKEEIEKDEALVKTLSSFLKDSILPRMVPPHFIMISITHRQLIDYLCFVFRPKSLFTFYLRLLTAKR